MMSTIQRKYRKITAQILLFALLAVSMFPGLGLQAVQAEAASQTISLHPNDATWTVTRGNPENPPANISTSSGNANIQMVVGDTAETTITVTQSAYYHVELDTLLTGHSGIHTIAIDGVTFKNEDGSDKRFDLYTPEGTLQSVVSLGQMELKAGEHTLTFHAVDTTATSTDSGITENRARAYVKSLVLAEVVPLLDTVAFTESELTLATGSSVIVDVYGTLDNGGAADLSLATVAYSSSDESVATINSAGVVEAVAIGNTTITATVTSGEIEKQAQMNVVVEGYSTLVYPFLQEVDGTKSLGADWTITDNTIIPIDGWADVGFPATTVVVNATGVGQYVTFGFEVPETADYQLTLDHGAISFGGIADISVDGTTIGTVDFYDAVKADSGKFAELETVSLTKGQQHQLKFEITGQNPGNTYVDERFVLRIFSMTFDKVEGPADSLQVSVADDSVMVGESTQISLASGSGATPEDVVYASSDKSIATVDSQGVVMAEGPGEATIYVQATLNGVIMVSSVDLLVTDFGTNPLSSVIMTSTGSFLTMTDTSQLTLKAKLADGTELDVTTAEGTQYTSEDAAVATVDAAGLITPVGPGSTNILASTTMGTVTKTARMSVVVVGDRVEGAWYPKVDFTGIHDFDGDPLTGKILVEFNATAMGTRIDGVMALLDSDETPTKYSHLPIILRMNTDGNFDGYNGGAYEALGMYQYRRGVTYHFEVIIDLDTQKYGAYVTTPEGDKTLIAADYSFRATAPTPDDIGRMILKTNHEDHLRVENAAISNTDLEVPARPEPAPLVPVTPSGNTITVDSFTGEAIQAAIDAAQDGDEIFLPAGTYKIKDTILIQKPIIMRGAAKLLNVGEIEWDIVESEENNIAPVWDGTPTELVYDESVPYTFDMIEVITESVHFEDIRFVGGLKDQDGYDPRTEDVQNSIDLRLNGVEIITGYAEVHGSEFTRHSQGLVMAGLGWDKTLKVRNSYFHENFRKSSGYGVVSESWGRGTLDIRDSEFARNRHDVIASTAINFYVIGNYHHSNDPVVKEYSIDLHPAADSTGRMVVRDNVMLNTGWIVYHGGSGEVTGNYFGPYELDYDGVNIGPSGGTTFLEKSKPHDIYIGRNINATGKDYMTVNGVSKLADLRTYDFDTSDSDPTKHYQAYNVYEDGVRYESVYTDYAPMHSDPAPKLGDMYVTEVDTGEIVKTVEQGVWYDLHAKAVDPQGADDIAKIGLQLRSANHAYLPGNEGGTYDAEGNFFIEVDESGLQVRETAGSGDWTALTGEGVFADGSQYTYANDASHQKGFTIRFRIPESAPEGQWYLNGYTVDQAGNIPWELDYLDQMSWEVNVVDDETPEPSEPFTVSEPVFTNWAGEAVTELTANEIIQVSVDITNHMDEAQDGTLIVALFNADNSFENMSYIHKSIEAQGTHTLHAGFKLPENTTGYKMKVFVWDSITGMIPLSNAVEFPAR